MGRTFNLSDSASQDILLNLLVFEVGHDLVDDSLGELSLLALLGCLFETDPAVKYRLELSSNSNLLLLDKGLGLDLSGLLHYT